MQWRHNGLHGAWNHQPHDCLLNGLFRCRSTKTSKLRVTGLCEGNSPVTGEFPAQRASNAENVSIWWRHHVDKIRAWYRPHKASDIALEYNTILNALTGDLYGAFFCVLWRKIPRDHCSDVIVGSMASEITNLTIVYSIVYSSADQRKHQSSASLAFVRGIHRWPLNSPHKGPVTRKMFPFDDVIMLTKLGHHFVDTKLMISRSNINTIFNALTGDLWGVFYEFFGEKISREHYSDVIMGAMGSQITSPTIVYSTVYSGTDKRKMKAPRRWPLWGAFTGDRWIPRIKGQ